MADPLEALVTRFFSSAGLVEPAGYRTIAVLLDGAAQPYFGGREYLTLAFSPETAREHPDAELVTYGSPLLDTVAEVAGDRGDLAHFYLNALHPSTGRTLEKVRAHARLSGHLLEAGKEQILLFHHALFRFKVSLVGEEREEFFRDVAVDLHTGWATFRLGESLLQLYGAGEATACPELKLQFGLEQALHTAVERLQNDIAPLARGHEERLRAACLSEQKQTKEHYQAMVARLEAGKSRKGADPDRIDAKVRATRADEARRLQDLECRFQLSQEVTLSQLALVSYPKATVPLRLQRGKEVAMGAAIWDSLAEDGYFAILPG